MDTATQIILGEVREVGRRLEIISANVDARAERQARAEEQWKASVDSLKEKIARCQKDIENIIQQIVGDGAVDGIRGQIGGLTKRVTELESASAKLGSEGRLATLEQQMREVLKAKEEAKDIAVVDREGMWNFKIESIKAKVAIISVLVGSVSGWGLLVIEIIKFLKGAR